MKIEHIKDLLPALEGRKDFVILDKHDYYVVDYVYIQKDTFDDPRRLECRGIKFDRDGRILARPFQKFFNLGEKQQEEDIDWDAEHVIYEKLDGSMIHPAILNGVPWLMTRKGITDVARKVQERFMGRPEYYEFMRHCLVDLEITPIFEFTAPDNRIVLPYEDSQLTLIGARDTVSGLHLPNWEMISLAATHEIPIATPDDEITSIVDVPRFIDYVRNEKGTEGVVIRFNDGHMIKLKSIEYLQQHGALNDMQSKKKVMALVLDGYADDLIPLLSDHDAHELREFEAKMGYAVDMALKAVEQVVSEGRLMDRKYFATVLLPARLAPEFHPAAFRALDGGDPREVICGYFKRNADKVGPLWRGE